MLVLNVAIGIFIFLESLNVLVLYFVPDLNKGNGVALFNFWHEAKKDPEQELFARYMAFWVAGTKLIFIALLAVVLFWADERTKVVSLMALTLTTATFFWKLYPIIQKLDGMGKITPKGYSKTLGLMIKGFITLFVSALMLYFALPLIS